MLVIIGMMVGIIGVMIGLYIISKIIYLARQERTGVAFIIFGVLTIIVAIIGVIALAGLTSTLAEVGTAASITGGYKGY